MSPTQTDKTTHRTQVLELIGPAYVAVCSCGYVGKDEKERANAAIAANTHKVSALRAK